LLYTNFAVGNHSGPSARPPTEVVVAASIKSIGAIIGGLRIGLSEDSASRSSEMLGNALMAAPRAYKVTREVVHLLAGKMNRDGRTVTPDDRRGMLRLVECDDGCMR
ncbi:hypothetical protein FOZ63_018630, partial [Perkinsus olseni]